MKKIGSFLMSLAAVGLLAACGTSKPSPKGKKVEEDNFYETAKAVQEHTYSKATATAEIKVDGDAPVGEEFKPGKVTAEFRNEGGNWITDSQDQTIMMATEYVGQKVGPVVEELVYANEHMEETSMGRVFADGLESDVTYYTAPLGVKLTVTGSYNASGVSAKVDSYGLAEFDQYGFTTRLYSEVNYSMSAGGQSMKFSIIQDVTITYVD